MVHAKILRMWRLEPCTAADRQKMQLLLERTMYEDEPLATTYNDTLKETVKCDTLVLDILAEGHSIKAVTPDGRIVGAAINKECPFSFDDVEPVASVREFFRYIDKQMQLDTRGLLDLNMLAVDPDFRRQGMAKALAQATEDHAFQAGFRGIKITATSQYTANVAKSLGYTVYYSIAYKDYKDNDGRPVFNTKPPHTHLNIMLKEFRKLSKI